MSSAVNHGSPDDFNDFFLNGITMKTYNSFIYLNIDSLLLIYYLALASVETDRSDVVSVPCHVDFCNWSCTYPFGMRCFELPRFLLLPEFSLIA